MLHKFFGQIFFFLPQYLNTTKQQLISEQVLKILSYSVSTIIAYSKMWLLDFGEEKLDEGVEQSYCISSHNGNGLCYGRLF